MNVRPPTYNPYIYNVQQSINIPSAPPLDTNEINHEVYQQQLQYPPKIENTPNYIYNQHVYATYPSCPPQIYIPTQSQYGYVNAIDQYQREEIHNRKKQDECFCFGIMAILCCCFINN
jgi:hypothetical protein